MWYSGEPFRFCLWDEETSPTASTRLFLMSDRLGRTRRKGTALQPDMVFEFVAEEFHTALDQHRCAGDQRTISRPLDEPAKLQEAVEIFLGALACLNLGHQSREIDRAHAARRALPATFAFEKIRKFQRVPDHAGGIVHHNHAG